MTTERSSQVLHPSTASPRIQHLAATAALVLLLLAAPIPGATSRAADPPSLADPWQGTRKLESIPLDYPSRAPGLPYSS
jgi:hypothetical protein